FLAATAAISNKPANCKRSTSVCVHLDWHLIIGAPNAASLHLKKRLAILDRLLEQLDSLFAATPGLDILHRLVKDALGGRLLSVPHHRVHEFRHQRRSVNWIRRDFPLGNVPFSRHSSVESFLPLGGAALGALCAILRSTLVA